MQLLKIPSGIKPLKAACQLTPPSLPMRAVRWRGNPRLDATSSVRPAALGVAAQLTGVAKQHQTACRSPQRRSQSAEPARRHHRVLLSCDSLFRVGVSDGQVSYRPAAR